MKENEAEKMKEQLIGVVLMIKKLQTDLKYGQDIIFPLKATD